MPVKLSARHGMEWAVSSNLTLANGNNHFVWHLKGRISRKGTSMSLNDGSEQNPADYNKMLAKLTKSALIGIVLVISGVLLALLAWRVFSAGPGRQLNVDNFTLVKVGMTQDEVEVLLGGPPGDYGENKSDLAMMTLEGVIGPQGSVEKVWFDDHHRFELFFDDTGKVVGLHKRSGFSRPKSNSNWLRRFLKYLGL
jgi:hypothetical protein